MNNNTNNNHNPSNNDSAAANPQSNCTVQSITVAIQTKYNLVSEAAGKNDYATINLLMSEIDKLEAEKRRLQLQNNNNHDNIMNDINDSLKRMSPTKPSNSTAPAAISTARTSKVARSPRKSPQSKPSEKKMRSNESSKSRDEEAIAPVINRASTLQSAPFAQQVCQPHIGANIDHYDAMHLDSNALHNNTEKYAMHFLKTEEGAERLCDMASTSARNGRPRGSSSTNSTTQSSSNKLYSNANSSVATAAAASSSSAAGSIAAASTPVDSSANSTSNNATQPFENITDAARTLLSNTFHQLAGQQFSTVSTRDGLDMDMNEECDAIYELSDPDSPQFQAFLYDIYQSDYDGDDKQWIPPYQDVFTTQAYRKNPQKVYKLNRQLSVYCKDSPPVGYRHPYSLKESEAIFGPERGGKGILKKAFPAYHTLKQRMGDKMRNPETTVVEDLGYYYCDAKDNGQGGCQRQILICRCSGGILVYELTDDSGVIGHNYAAHREVSQSDKRKGPLSFTVKQKEFVLKEYGKAGAHNRVDVANLMSQDGLLSTEQKQNMANVRRQITDLTKNKEKHFKHQWHTEIMNQAQLVEALDKLIVPNGIEGFINESRNPSTTLQPPNQGSLDSKTENYFLDTDLYETLGNKMVVLDHDYGDGGNKSYITFMPKDALERAEKAAAMFSDEEGKYKNTVQFGCDFTPLGDGTGIELGHAGFYDFKHKYYPIVYVIAKHENKERSIDMMVPIQKLVAAAGGTDLTCLSDASLALETAATCLGILMRRCFAHVIRLPDGTKRNSKQGTKGSLYRYVRNTMGMSAKITTKVSTKLPSLMLIHLISYLNLPAGM